MLTKRLFLSQAWPLMPAIPELCKPRQEDLQELRPVRAAEGHFVSKS